MMAQDSAGFPPDRMYWVGVDPIAPHVEEPHALRAVFESIAANEGLDPQTMTSLVLAHQDARGDIGARYVAAFRLGADEDVESFVRRRRSRVWPSAADLTPRWRVVFERFLEVGRPEPRGSSVVLVAMSPAADARDDQVDDFNFFYNGTHLPEVLGDWDWQRASRYELRAELLHPAPGCPRYLAVYEVGPDSRSLPRSAEGAQSYSSGPYAWESRDTAWRLRYDVV